VILFPAEYKPPLFGDRTLRTLNYAGLLGLPAVIEIPMVMGR